MMNDNKDYGNLKISAIVSYFISGIFLCVGFFKLLVYDNDSYDTTNAYVGGDAYNYIINANYATAYFTLAIFFTIVGGMFLVGYYLLNSQSSNISSNDSQNITVHKEEF